MSRPLSPEALVYGLTVANDPQVSPAGDLVAYTLVVASGEKARPRRQVWLCRIDGTDARPLTEPPLGAAGARWSPDGGTIAFTGASGGGRSIFTLDVAAGDAEPGELVRHAQDVGELAWSPDAHTIAYTTLFDPENPDEAPEPPGAAPRVRVTRRLDYKEDGRGYLGDKRTQVFTVEIAGGGRRRVTSEPLDHVAPEWSPDGRHLGMRVHLADRAGMELRVLDVESGATERIEFGRGQIVHWVFSPDGGRILFAGDPDHSMQADYFVHDRATGTTERLTTDLRSAPEAPAPVWLDDRRALFHSMLAGASALQTIDVESGRVELLERGESRNAGLSVDRGGRRVVQAECSLETIGEIRVLELGSEPRVRTITSHNAAVLEDAPPARWEAFTVARPDFEIDAWLLKPADFDPARSYPIVLDVHGGPNANYGYGFLAHEQCLATNGFLVIVANPRGSTSYGREFAQQSIRNWGRGDYEDYLAVLDTVLERPYADGERTGIFGISYGGYMTSWAIGQTNRFRAAVCGEPIFDLESDYGTSDIAWNGLERYGGGQPHEEREWYTSSSPSTYAHRTRTPTLIFAGEADHRCPIGQSEQMFVALRKAGCEVEFVRYPGGSHMFFAQGIPEHRLDFLERTLGWFKEHLGEPR